MPGTDPNQVVSDYQNYTINLDPGAEQRGALRDQASDNKWNSAYAAGIPTHLRMALQSADQRNNQQALAYERQNAEYGKSGMELARKQSLLPQLVQSGQNTSGFTSQAIQKPSIWSSILNGAATVGSAAIMASDERLKDIEGKSDAGLKEVKRLNPIIYKYKEGTGLDDATHKGLSAQEVEKSIPGAVSRLHPEPDTDEAGGASDSDADNGMPANPRMINYEAITSALVNSVKDLSSQVEALKKGKR